MSELFRTMGTSKLFLCCVHGQQVSHVVTVIVGDIGAPFTQKGFPDFPCQLLRLFEHSLPSSGDFERFQPACGQVPHTVACLLCCGLERVQTFGTLQVVPAQFFRVVLLPVAVYGPWVRKSLGADTTVHQL